MAFNLIRLQGCDKISLIFSKNVLAMSNVFKRMDDGIYQNLMSFF